VLAGAASTFYREVMLAVLNTCPECGGRVARRRHTFDVRIGRRTVAVEGDYARCEGDCREFYFAAGEMDAAMVRASAVIRGEEGLLTPVEIKALRKRIGLTQPQMETLLGAGPKTVTRWEKGTVIQNGATDTLLRLIRDVPEALQHLLRQHGIATHVVPLIPEARRVSYTFAAPASSPIRMPPAIPLAMPEATVHETPVPVERAERIA
jgi:HTH-type transcriptional regulator / antitoxin MqsA